MGFFYPVLQVTKLDTKQQKRLPNASGSQAGPYAQDTATLTHVPLRHILHTLLRLSPPIPFPEDIQPSTSSQPVIFLKFLSFD